MSIPETHIQALRLILNMSAIAGLNWVVTGSAGMALQGVPIEVHDLDIQTDRDGAYQLGELLSDYVVTRVRYRASERIRSHLGEYEFAGVKVEIMGAIEKLVAGVWEQPVDVRKHRRWVELNSLSVPVLDLEYELEAYAKLGRVEKAEMLQTWLTGRPSFKTR